MQSSHCVATPIATAIRRLPRAPADPCGRIQARAGYSPACPRSAEIRDSARDRSCPSWASMQPASDGRNLPRRAPRRIARAEADTHPANHIARHRGGAAMRPPRKTIGEHVDKRPIDARQRGAAHRALARRHGPSQTIRATTAPKFTKEHRRTRCAAPRQSPERSSRHRRDAWRGRRRPIRARAAPTDYRRTAAGSAPPCRGESRVDRARDARVAPRHDARSSAGRIRARTVPERSQCFACAIAIRIAPPSDMPSLKNASAISAALSRTQGIRLRIGAG